MTTGTFRLQLFFFKLKKEGVECLTQDTRVLSNEIGQVPLLDILDRHGDENKVIVVNLCHHQFIPACFQVESLNTLAYLAENIGHYMPRNYFDNFENLSYLNLENL